MESFSPMEKLVKIAADIASLDELNMTTILSDQGIEFSFEGTIKDIVENNFGLQNVLCYYSEDDILWGYVRFNFDSENNIIVRSIQLRPNSNRFGVMKMLMYTAYKQLTSLRNEMMIYAWVNVNNTKSFALLEKLGFTYKGGHRDASKLSTSKTDLIAKLESMRFNELFTQLTHPGQFPIRVLRHNLPHTLATHKLHKTERIKAIVSDGKVNPGIEYTISEKFSLISVNGDTKTIQISEQFLAFLWAFIYSSFLVIEEGIQTTIIMSGSNVWDGKIDNRRPIVKRAQELYSWAISLPKSFSIWPNCLPNPELYFSAEEQFYINKVNGIYLKAATYLINHEIAHLVNSHVETLKAYREKGYAFLTEDERNHYKSIEGEADLYAREEIVEQDDDEKLKLAGGLAIVLAHCASLFAISNPSGLVGNVHPDLDNRIFHAVNYLNLQNQADRDYIFLTAAMSFNLFFGFNEEALNKAGYQIPIPKEMEDPEEYFNECLKIVDEIKELYQGLSA